MSRRIDDRSADLSGRGLGTDRQGAGSPEQEETHKPEQPTTHIEKDTAIEPVRTLDLDVW